MKPLSIALAIVAGLAIALLIGSGSDGRTFADQAMAGVSSRPAQPLSGVVAVTTPDQAIVVILDEKLVPPDAAAALSEARALIAASATQSPDQAKASLEQAVAKIDVALDSIEKAVDDTSNLATKMSLERIYTALTSVRDEVQAKLDQM